MPHDKENHKSLMFMPLSPQEMSKTENVDKGIPSCYWSFKVMDWNLNSFLRNHGLMDLWVIGI